MKKFFLFSACILLGLYSCNKKGVIKPKTPLTYAITANINGKEETFDLGDSVRNIGTTGVYFTGTNDTTQDRIAIYAYNYTTALTTGTYTDTTSTGLSQSQILFYPSGDQNNYYYSYYAPAAYVYPSFVTISTLPGGSIQGSFNGSVVLANYIIGTAGLSSKTITNGTFNIATK
jgi:hypothetical protein